MSIGNLKNISKLWNHQGLVLGRYVKKYWRLYVFENTYQSRDWTHVGCTTVFMASHRSAWQSWPCSPRGKWMPSTIKCRSFSIHLITLMTSAVSWGRAPICNNTIGRLKNAMQVLCKLKRKRGWSNGCSSYVSCSAVSSQISSRLRRAGATPFH